MPPATDLYDENYGHTQVYFHQVQFKVSTEASKTYQVTWQGCAQDRICYPPQTIEFQTDIDGLVLLQNQAQISKRLLDLSASSNSSVTAQNALSAGQNSLQPTVRSHKILAKDQMWSETLAESSLVYGLLLFFGLGIFVGLYAMFITDAAHFNLADCPGQ